MTVPSCPLLRVAVVGSGPSGFYAAGHLLSRAEQLVEVDLFERLPTPWGLVRGGVAPDHPKIKSVSRVFEKVARDPRLRFFGNVEVGRDVTHEELAGSYSAVVYAIGAAGARRGGIPGEDLAGSWSASDFVGWYNGHPDHETPDPDLSCRRAVVIGNGNVALDVARMLALSPAELATTDIADHALAALASSAVEEIIVLGRRGPEQAAFTTPELRELGEVAGADVCVDPGDLDIPEGLRDPRADASTMRNLELLETYSGRPAANRRRIVLRFLASPLELIGDGMVGGVRITRNELVRREDGRLQARSAGGEELLEAGLVVSAIGYTGVPVPKVPFDETRSVVPNVSGRVCVDGRRLPGVYVAGWIKRGPTGVIGTNKRCAQETVNALLDDAAAGRLDTETPNGADVATWLRARCPALVDYAGWEAIDELERSRGARNNRPRVKFTHLGDLLDAAGVAPPIAPSQEPRAVADVVA